VLTAWVSTAPMQV